MPDLDRPSHDSLTRFSAMKVSNEVETGYSRSREKHIHTALEPIWKPPGDDLEYGTKKAC